MNRDLYTIRIGPAELRALAKSRAARAWFRSHRPRPFGGCATEAGFLRRACDVARCLEMRHATRHAHRVDRALRRAERRDVALARMRCEGSVAP